MSLIVSFRKSREKRIYYVLMYPKKHFKYLTGTEPWQTRLCFCAFQHLSLFTLGCYHFTHTHTHIHAFQFAAEHFANSNKQMTGPRSHFILGGVIADAAQVPLLSLQLHRRPRPAALTFNCSLILDGECAPVTLENFLELVSGSSSIPSNGFLMQPTIEILPEDSGKIFPEANTCNIVLKLPVHKDFESFKAQMCNAILWAPTFSMA